MAATVVSSSCAKHWLFTINNYDENDLLRLSPTSNHLSEETVRYCIWQEEKGEKSGLPHIQGYIAFHSKKRISAIKKVVGDRAHLILAKGNAEQNRDYCSKSHTRKEGTETRSFGTIPLQEAGKRNDIIDYRDACKEGNMTLKRTFEDHTVIACKYPRFVNTCINLYATPPPVKSHPFRPWQKDLDERLKKPPHDRDVVFIVDFVGNQGKTWFAKQYRAKNPEETQYMETGKKADMSYALANVGKRVLFVNVSRKQVENIQYSFLEAVKDGVIFSPKYESMTKYIHPMHVIVMMNEMPDPVGLSKDRYDIVILPEKETTS